jgi:hypothetical protein
MSLSDFPYPTSVQHLPVAKYPIVGAWGKQQISSKAWPGGVDQQFVDTYGRQNELGLKRQTLGPDPKHGGYLFGWELTFYTHPGHRRRIPVEIYEPGHRKMPKNAPGLTIDELKDLVDRMHGMTSDERLWMAFHTYGMHKDSGFQNAKQAYIYLKDMGLPWAYAQRNLPKEATEHQGGWLTS